MIPSTIKLEVVQTGCCLAKTQTTLVSWIALLPVDIDIRLTVFLDGVSHIFLIDKKGWQSLFFRRPSMKYRSWLQEQGNEGANRTHSLAQANSYSKDKVEQGFPEQWLIILFEQYLILYPALYHPSPLEYSFSLNTKGFRPQLNRDSSFTRLHMLNLTF